MPLGGPIAGRDAGTRPLGCRTGCSVAGSGGRLQRRTRGWLELMIKNIYKIHLFFSRKHEVYLFAHQFLTNFTRKNQQQHKSIL
jgi:hypothetical protein